MTQGPSEDSWSTHINHERDARKSASMRAVDDLQRAWANFDRLVEELGIQWPEGVDAVEAVREIRREL